MFNLIRGKRRSPLPLVWQHWCCFLDFLLRRRGWHGGGDWWSCSHSRRQHVVRLLKYVRAFCRIWELATVVNLSPISRRNPNPIADIRHKRMARKLASAESCSGQHSICWQWHLLPLDMRLSNLCIWQPDPCNWTIEIACIVAKTKSKI